MFPGKPELLLTDYTAPQSYDGKLHLTPFSAVIARLFFGGPS